MGLLGWLFGIEKSVEEWDFGFLPPFYTFNEPVMYYLEKRGIKLEYPHNKRNLMIVGFSSVEQLNIFLSLYSLQANLIKNPGQGHNVSGNARLLFDNIKIFALRGTKKDFKKNVEKAGLALYKTGNLFIYYAP